MTKYTENKFLQFSPSQLYNIVSDIESYPSFLPWVADASVDKTKTITCDAITTLEAEICIKFNVYKERFVSLVTLNPDDLKISTTDISGPFKWLENNWCFLEKNNGCQVKFEVDFPKDIQVESNGRRSNCKVCETKRYQQYINNMSQKKVKQMYKERHANLTNEQIKQKRIRDYEYRERKKNLPR